RETSTKWLKPFDTEWTWRAIKDAQSEEEAKIVLKNWIHKIQAKEVVDKMIEGMRKHDCTNMIQHLFITCYQSPTSERDLTTKVQIETLTTWTTYLATALIDSGCTGSSINHAFI
ncbi:uncharacterized protein BT62DRAFT_874041, partial [Guyanagaster necrorhizus]